MDQVLPTDKLFKQNMEFELIDYLVKMSDEYKSEIR